MVALVGLEPTRYCYHRILSPARLPISPQSHLLFLLYHKSYAFSIKTIYKNYLKCAKISGFVEENMGLALGISVVIIALMIFMIIRFPKIKLGKFELQTFWIVPLIGIIVIFILGLIDIDSALKGLVKNDSVNPIKILILFFSMTFMSIILDELGFFEYMANLALKRCSTNQTKLFFSLYLLTSLLTIFTSNDIIILTFTPFIVFFTKSAKINPIPYLVSEFVAANTWSMMFIIGNPTNIYLATSFNIGFVEYFLKMVFPTIASGVTGLTILYLIFRKELKKEMVIEYHDVHVKSHKLVVSDVIILGFCTLVLVVSSYIGLEMYIVALSCALMMLAILILYSIKKHNTVFLFDGFKRIPWSLAPFLVSMFIIVLTDDHYQITEKIRASFNYSNDIFTYGISSTLMCNLINNIPMSVLYSSIIPSGNIKALFSTIIGSNIGAFLTPIGALAGIMWLSILKKYNIKYGFLSFIKYGVIVAIPTLLVALLTLLIVL